MIISIIDFLYHFFGQIFLIFIPKTQIKPSNPHPDRLHPIVRMLMRVNLELQNRQIHSVFRQYHKQTTCSQLEVKSMVLKEGKEDAPPIEQCPRTLLAPENPLCLQ